MSFKTRKPAQIDGHAAEISGNRCRVWPASRALWVGVTWLAASWVGVFACVWVSQVRGQLHPLILHCRVVELMVERAGHGIRRLGGVRRYVGGVGVWSSSCRLLPGVADRSAAPLPRPASHRNSCQWTAVCLVVNTMPSGLRKGWKSVDTLLAFAMVVGVFAGTGIGLTRHVQRLCPYIPFRERLEHCHNNYTNSWRACGSLSSCCRQAHSRSMQR